MTVSLTAQAEPYLALAQKLVDGRITEDQLPDHTTNLPPLHRELLDYLAAQADDASLRLPKYSWAAAAVADAVASHLPDVPFLQALAAWYLARAANAWTRPRRVETAVARARAGFTALGESGWLAACDWQLNALPWTRPNFQQAAAELASALAGLEKEGWDAFAADCRLSLAYAHLLTGDFDAAARETESSQQYFNTSPTPLGQGRCLLTQASYLRRQSKFNRAQDCLQEALTFFETQAATVYVGMTKFQLALAAWLSAGDFQAAESHFKRAADIFENADLPLWSGQCYGGLAQIYNNLGRLAEAGEALRKAGEVYGRFQIRGLQADNLLDSAEWELVRGNFTSSLSYLIQAKYLYEQIGNRWLPVVITKMQGELMFQLGRYFQALHHLEQALTHFQELEIPHREAECGTSLAHIWLYLGRFDLAHDYVDAVIDYYRRANQFLALPEIYNLRARIFFEAGRENDAIDALQQALAAAQRQNNQAQTALGQRLLGEALPQAGEKASAFAYLQAAAGQFEEMGLVMEQAACQAAWGRYYQQLADPQAARTAWTRSLQLSQGMMPDISWPAHAGLAQIAAAAGENQMALEQYRLAGQSLAQVRSGLWQANLIGSYFGRPSEVMDEAVAFAAKIGSVTDVVTFVEDHKATLAARHINNGRLNSPQDGSASDGLMSLASEVRWLQEKIRVDFKDRQGWLRPAEERRLRQQLVQKVKAYSALKDKLEREQPLDHSAVDKPFDLTRFRQLAQSRLGHSWLALDFHLADKQLHTILVTPTDCLVWSKPISGRIRLALHLLNQPGRAGQDLTAVDLAALGNWLVPDEVRHLLTADTTLIIAPHRQLHRLPWAAITVAEQPLVATSIPVVVPSLNVLMALWQRPYHPRPLLDNGLLLAISDFQGRYPALPHVEREANALGVYFAANGRQLRETEATKDNLCQLRADNGLSQFSCWHIASHAFHDPVNGRLSGLALYDGDIWLDELWDCAPLPPLVVLSGCNSSQSLVYDGDEHVGLAVTCLAAGAQSFVGNLWPVPDVAVARLMPAFYAHIAAGRSAAEALALAQRESWQRKEPAFYWSGFCCTGEP